MHADLCSRASRSIRLASSGNGFWWFSTFPSGIVFVSPTVSPGCKRFSYRSCDSVKTHCMIHGCTQTTVQGSSRSSNFQSTQQGHIWWISCISLGFHQRCVPIPCIQAHAHVRCWNVVHTTFCRGFCPPVSWWECSPSDSLQPSWPFPKCLVKV